MTTPINLTKKLLNYLAPPTPTRCPSCKSRPNDPHRNGCPHDA